MTVVTVAAIICILVAIFGNPPYPFYANLKLGVLVSGLSLSTWLLFARDRLKLLGLPILFLAATHGFASKSRDEWITWNWLATGLWAFTLGWIWYGRKRRNFPNAETERD